MKGYNKEYRKGQYYFQNMHQPLDDYQQTKSFKNGVDSDMLGSKIRDKKTHFVEPANKLEQEKWLDQLIADIQDLQRNQYADLLTGEIEFLLNLIIPVLEQEPIIVEVEAPLVIGGDIHGQLHDLLRFFNTIGPPPNRKYLFQGDYVDRSPHDVEVITLLFAYKLRYPEHMIMLRGNHECRLINQTYGFKESCKRTFDRDGLKIWRKFSQAF